MRQRRVAEDGDLSAVIALTVALVALVREIAAWQRELGRAHHAAAARACATGLDGWSRRAAVVVRATGRAAAERAHTAA
jgi:hypothetical protein